MNDALQQSQPSSKGNSDVGSKQPLEAKRQNKQHNTLHWISRRLFKPG